MTYEEAVCYIGEIPKFTKKHTLEETGRFLHRLKDPQEAFRCVHVAGTNGKGSVCAFLYEALMLANEDAALFTSPHLNDVRERFRIGRTPVDPDGFLDAFHQVLAAVTDEHPSYFEFLFAMACVMFKERGVRLAVLETGLGGRLDATNVIRHPEVCVITSISPEHQQYLGNTITEIAGEKAGILKTEVPVVYDAADPESTAVIEARAEHLSCPQCRVLPDQWEVQSVSGQGIDFSFQSRYDGIVPLHINAPALYQVKNACLSYEAMHFLPFTKKPDVQLFQEAVRRMFWPGRMQEIRDGMYLDGAHNIGGIEALVQTVERIGGDAPVLLFAIMKDKDVAGVCRLLRKIPWGSVLLCEAKEERSFPAKELSGFFPDRPTEVLPDAGAALARAEAFRLAGHRVFCSGSLYFIGELLKECSMQEDEHV